MSDYPVNKYGKTLPCAACGNPNNSATSFTTQAGPADGDVSICINCGEVGIYVVNALGISIREPSLDELAEIQRDHGEWIAASIAERRTRGRR